MRNKTWEKKKYARGNTDTDGRRGITREKKKEKIKEEMTKEEGEGRQRGDREEEGRRWTTERKGKEIK